MFNRLILQLAVARNFQDLPHRQVSNQKKSMIENGIWIVKLP